MSMPCFVKEFLLKTFGFSRDLLLYLIYFAKLIINVYERKII